MTMNKEDTVTKLINWLFSGVQKHWMVEPLLKLTAALFIGYIIGCVIAAIRRVFKGGDR